MGTLSHSPWLEECRVCAHPDLQLQAVLFCLLAQQAPHGQVLCLAHMHLQQTRGNPTSPADRNYPFPMVISH